MDEALRVVARRGAAVDALLRWVRQRLPDRHTLTIDALYPARYESFLKEAVGDLRSLVRERHEELDYYDDPVPVLGWHAGRWKGHDIELMMPPGEEAETVVAVGGSREVLRAFAKALREYSDRPEGRAMVFSGSSWRSDRGLEREIAKTSWEEVVLPPEQVAEIRAAAGAFFSRRDVYRSLGVAWRRGVLLVGPPGTGKTMICKAVAGSLPEVPFLYVRDFSGRVPDEEQIHDVFERARELSPCVLVFEDIDGFVGDRNRAVFLNELDGFKENDGMLVLASSNHPERIDEALLKRPSRFDRVFRIAPPAEAERREYCRRFLAQSRLRDGLLADDLDVESLCTKVAARTGGFTPAHLKEAFVGAALERAHEASRKEAVALLDGEEFAAAVLRQVEALKGYMSDSRDPGKLADPRDAPERRPGFRAGERG
jgi:SpoVK/Ycf46/Vps4 family AAA+-type ATPase